MNKEANIVVLDAIAAKASKFTGRTLGWSIKQGVFSLSDTTTLGNLGLAVAPHGGLREVYMRARNFGLNEKDLEVVKAHL
jgi:hypothetical protein